jgi:hypothetical protein
MKLRTLNLLPLAAASVLTALALVPMASAADNRANLGPVGPYEPILATFGDKRVIAYYERDGDECDISAIVFDASAAGGGHASTRIRTALRPGEIFNLDAVADERVMLTCGPNAAMLTVLNRGEVLTMSARKAIN